MSMWLYTIVCIAYFAVYFAIGVVLACLGKRYLPMIMGTLEIFVIIILWPIVLVGIAIFLFFAILIDVVNECQWCKPPEKKND